MAEITDVLIKLLESTHLGRVKWKPTADERTFVVALGNTSVMIQGSTDGRPRLRILNKAGVEIERMDGDETPEIGLRQALNELYLKARRLALGVESQLDDLMRELETIT